jgi:hypothetical protein
MDYARFNYVAQPEDSISEGGIIPIIGAYDVWAIQWGYKWFHSSNSLNEEKEISAKWITTRLEQDKRLWYEDEKTERDPRNQAEDLGNDAIKAGLYGIKNLQRIMLHLVDWSKEQGKNYERLDYQYNLVVNQYKLYLQHVIKYIGGTLYNPITSDQHEKAFEFLEKSRQQAAVKFLGDQLFTTPTWLFNEKLYELRGGGASYELLLLQHNVLKILFDQSLFSALQRFEAHQSQKAYTTIEYLTDLKMSIWAELRIPKTIDFCRRNLQKEYVNNLIGLLLLMNERDNPNIVILNTDFISVVKGHIKSLIKDIDIALPQCPDEITKLHLVDVKERLTDAMQKRFQNK